MECTPEYITELKPNEIFVFGSNSWAKHGLGAAYTARTKFGAINGQAEGLQGQSYGIVTKDLRAGKRGIDLSYIGKQVQNLILFAKTRPDLKFYITKIGTDLAGYTIEEMREIFLKLERWIPDNVVLPIEFEVRGYEE